MKWIGIGIVLLVVLGGVWWLQGPREPAAPAVYVGSDSRVETDPGSTLVSKTHSDMPPVEVVAENLSVPWEVVFLPDGELLVTERPGRLLLLKEGIEIAVPGVRSTGEGGLLGVALHPDFATNNFIYLYETTVDGIGLSNQIVRYTLRDGELVLDRVVVADLPGAIYHDGGRLAFGPDGYLYATVGDALDPAEAQNKDSLEGTIIRMTAEGEVAPGNPFGTLVYSYGHRNPQGLTWDSNGRLWSSEHGRSGARSGFDEINLITAGGNYGWPDSEGDTVLDDTIAPARHSSASVTWAPGDLQYLDGSLYLPGLRGETLYQAMLNETETEIVAWQEHFVDEYGRLRSVRVGPDGHLYLLTSNRDGRGNPTANDDRIIRIDTTQLSRTN